MDFTDQTGGERQITNAQTALGKLAWAQGPARSTVELPPRGSNRNMYRTKEQTEGQAEPRFARTAKDHARGLNVLRG
jgi:hypothetical protein